MGSPETTDTVAGSPHGSAVRGWLIATLAGIAASGWALGSWSLGGAFGIRDAAALAGTIASGIAVGLILGRYRLVVVASLAGAIPLLAVGVFGNPSSTSSYAGLFMLLSTIIAATSSAYFLVSGLIGVAVGRRVGLGPAAGQRVLVMLILGSAVTVAGWMWFELSLRPSS